jgi:hypothetical protein
MLAFTGLLLPVLLLLHGHLPASPPHHAGGAQGRRAQVVHEKTVVVRRPPRAPARYAAPAAPVTAPVAAKAPAKKTAAAAASATKSAARRLRAPKATTPAPAGGAAEPGEPAAPAVDAAAPADVPAG